MTGFCSEPVSGYYTLTYLYSAFASAPLFSFCDPSWISFELWLFKGATPSVFISFRLDSIGGRWYSLPWKVGLFFFTLDMFFLYLDSMRNSSASFFELIAPLFEKSLCANLWFSLSILSFSLFLSDRFRLFCLAPVAVIDDAPLILASKVLAFLFRDSGLFDGNIELCFP